MQNVNKSEATSMLTTRFRSSSPSSSQTGTGRFRSEAAATLNSSVNLFSSFFYHLIVHSCLFFRLQDIIYGAFKSRQLSRAVASDKPGHNDGTVTGSPRDQSLHVRLAQRHLLHAALPAPGPGQDPPPDVADWHAAGVEQAWHDDGVSPRGEDRAAAGTLERSVAGENLLLSILTGLPISHVTAAALPLSQSFVRTIPGVGLYFSTYYTLTQHFIPEGSPGALEAVLLGGGARTVAGVFMLPVTVIKTRFECGRYSYGSVTGALRSVCSSEGPAALFSGLMPTLLRDVPFSGIYVMFYSQTKTSLPQEIRESHYAPLANFACGVLAGVLASLVTQPADVVKTQVQVNPQLRTSEAVRIIYTEHGLQGFLRGAVPRSLRRTLMAAMAWTVYEQMMARIGLKS